MECLGDGLHLRLFLFLGAVCRPCRVQDLLKSLRLHHFEYGAEYQVASFRLISIQVSIAEDLQGCVYEAGHTDHVLLDTRVGLQVWPTEGHVALHDALFVALEAVLRKHYGLHFHADLHLRLRTGQQVITRRVQGRSELRLELLIREAGNEISLHGGSHFHRELRLRSTLGLGRRSRSCSTLGFGFGLLACGPPAREHLGCRM
mmetsp:Transcript_132745/g.283606  ORF Transcript_132745/g.283606 Transcript_132745/m.283606 type:complete len:203 (+) Transcript_132745:586-1194(+)